MKPLLYLLAALFIAALILAPGIALAALCILGSLAAVAGGLWLGQAWRVSKEYDAAHDLPDLRDVQHRRQAMKDSHNPWAR